MYIFRADGNAKIGAGHLMRCLTVAEALAEKAGSKEEICFVCADQQSGEAVKAAGFRVQVFNTDYRRMEEELLLWNVFGRDNRILVDSYYVTDAYLEKLRQFGKVFLLDDMSEHAYPVDGVINYNAFAKEAAYQRLYADSETGIQTKCYIGSKYVPVRRQFLNREYGVGEAVKDVLITTGGGDLDNIAGEMLQSIYREGIDFHVVTGRFNPHLEELKKLEKTQKGVHIYHDVKDMAELMQRCDMAITAGGTTIYELAVLGIPFLCFSYARNQEALAEYIGTNQIAGYLGKYHQNQEEVLRNLQKLFAEYCADRSLREMCYNRERTMIDGNGASRLAEILCLG